MNKTKRTLSKLFALVLMVCVVFSLAIIVSSAAETSATIAFTSGTRISFSSTKTVFQDNGITVTNDKASSSTANGDYVSPARWYQGSKLTIEAPGVITKIVINVDTSKPVSATTGSISADVATVTYSGSVVTVVPEAQSNTFVIEKFSAQARHTSMQVYYEEGAACDHNYQVTETVPSTCLVKGTTTEVCSKCGDKQVTYLELGDHNYVENVCSVCKKIDPESVDYSGRYYFAAIRKDADSYVYMSNEKAGGKDRYLEVDSGVAELPEAITAPEANLVFVVVRNADYTYSVYSEGNNADARYIGWTNGNYMNTVTEAEAVKFTIDANEDGTYSFHFAASDGERYIALNTNADNNYFSIYKSTGGIIKLSLVPVEEAPAAPQFEYANVTLGADLGINFTVTVPAGTPTMDVILNGEETIEVKNVIENGNGYYTFVFTGIGPHQMADTIDAILYVDGEVADEFYDYSIETNLASIKNDNKDDAALTALVDNLLIYGSAAEKYVGKTENLVSVNGLVASDATPEGTAAPENNAGANYIVSAGVRYDSVNQIFVKIYLADANTVVTVDGEEVELIDLGNGYYKLYTAGIQATDFDRDFNIVVGDATLTYSVNDYAAAMQNSEKSAELALALYRYGVTAEAYAATVA